MQVAESADFALPFAVVLLGLIVGMAQRRPYSFLGVGGFPSQSGDVAKDVGKSDARQPDGDCGEAYSPQPRSRPTMLSRRLLVSLAALTASPAVGDEAVSDGALRNKILRTLSRVPVFTVTNGSDAPYLTEVDEQGRRSGFFYLGPQDAANALKDVKAFGLPDADTLKTAGKSDPFIKVSHTHTPMSTDPDARPCS